MHSIVGVKKAGVLAPPIGCFTANIANRHSGLEWGSAEWRSHRKAYSMRSSMGDAKQRLNAFCMLFKSLSPIDG